ncbi:riboflavin synthase [Puniceicoccales bacterium CK1056]|uniref:Riboflavin synthase n=1 Tax=Oceanipulchritudo coccoides TaxID=2706888 RepID=A0A6B2M5U6_9BACT|nr:riboflavin synthase [Oceanipulchritudo coccoides]NDV63529.1 riboflavin synthase [Oceanipulchritudo coccoides]
MFTGIIEETGKVLEFSEQEAAYRLKLAASRVLEGLEMGDSIAVNGCCLTAIEFDQESVSFDLLQESVRLTSFQTIQAGDPVNLERSLRFNGKIGGHFVTGHIDATGKVSHAERRGKDLFLRIEPPEAFLKYLVYKGSIAIDGVSLTVAEVDQSGFAVWLIPHTLEVTNLHAKAPGSLVNLEFDLLAKTLERLFPGNRPIERS